MLVQPVLDCGLKPTGALRTAQHCKQGHDMWCDLGKIAQRHGPLYVGYSIRSLGRRTDRHGSTASKHGISAERARVHRWLLSCCAGRRMRLERGRCKHASSQNSCWHTSIRTCRARSSSASRPSQRQAPTVYASQLQIDMTSVARQAWLAQKRRKVRSTHEGRPCASTMVATSLRGIRHGLMMVLQR